MTIQEFTRKAKDFETVLFARALRMTRSRDLALDLVKATNEKAAINRKEDLDSDNLKTYLTSTMQSTFQADFLSRILPNRSSRATPAPVAEPTATVELSATKMDMKFLVGAIDDIYSVPFMMYYSGYEYQQIAAKLALPVGTVKSRIFSARVQMKQLIRGSVAA